MAFFHERAKSLSFRTLAQRMRVERDMVLLNIDCFASLWETIVVSPIVWRVLMAQERMDKIWILHKYAITLDNADGRAVE